MGCARSPKMVKNIFSKSSPSCHMLLCCVYQSRSHYVAPPLTFPPLIRGIIPTQFLSCWRELMTSEIQDPHETTKELINCPTTSIYPSLDHDHAILPHPHFLLLLDKKMHIFYVVGNKAALIIILCWGLNSTRQTINAFIVTSYTSELGTLKRMLYENQKFTITFLVFQCFSLLQLDAQAMFACLNYYVQQKTKWSQMVS